MRINFRVALLLLAGCLVVAACSDPSDAPADAAERVEAPGPQVPAWAQDAIFYQIFPERFRDGDPSNNPTRETLELPYDNVPESWTVRSWTSDWYARDAWEEEMSEAFYDPIFDRRYGGDLQGVIDQLPYLDSLGVNALYFNPVFWGRSLHKYDGNSFHHVDPHFGPDPEGDAELMAQEDPTDPETWRWTAADLLFLDLVEAAHARDIRVVIDGVWNHTGRDFFAFADLYEHQEDSEFVDWYVVQSFRDPDDPDAEFAYDGWWDYEHLPEFAENEDGTDLHEGPKEYIFNVTERWMQPVVDGEARNGVDGWRLDVANEVPTGFWQDWNAFVRELNPEAYTVPEIWQDASDFIAEGGFSATMNYYAFAYPVKGFLIDNTITPAEFGEMLAERREAYPSEVQFAVQNLIDSHDTERLASMLVNKQGPEYEEPYRFDYDVGPHVSPRFSDTYDVHAPDERQRELQQLVALFQMTYVGAPMIYYGTEAGMWGADDPDDRKPMVWPDLAYEDEASDPLGRDRTPDPVAFDHDLFDFYRSLIHLRRDHAALRRGDFNVLAADTERTMFAFERSYEDASLVVVLNRSEEAHSARIPLGRTEERPYEPIFTTVEEGYRVQQDAEALLLELPERSGIILQRQ